MAEEAGPGFSQPFVEVQPIPAAHLVVRAGVAETWPNSRYTAQSVLPNSLHLARQGSESEQQGPEVAMGLQPMEYPEGPGGTKLLDWILATRLCSKTREQHFAAVELADKVAVGHPSEVEVAHASAGV